jgi:hypothetical protein
MTDDVANPVEHLSLPLRLAAGPVVSRLYEAKEPKFMKRVENIGVRGAALLTCCQVLAGYSLAFMVAGCVVFATPDAPLSSILLPLSMIFSFWTISVMLALNKARHTFEGFGDKSK